MDESEREHLVSGDNSEDSLDLFIPRPRMQLFVIDDSDYFLPFAYDDPPNTEPLVSEENETHHEEQANFKIIF
ncbi:unnamed protein product [Macrosiphum euphorbiae]|uniref:Uncharacterized protein n=1 Tax=Macrosiphum euphorbiae TaxID=13131 RepID=A0AAV0XL87_9HEMI|nr:unnamed protein product [Macrosiphum euphorbiae]